MEGIALVQLFTQDPAHLGPAQGHLLCHDALWLKKGSLTKQENNRAWGSWPFSAGVLWGLTPRCLLIEMLP